MDISIVLWSLAVGLLVVGAGIIALLFIQSRRNQPNVSNLLVALEPLVKDGIAAALVIFNEASDEVRKEMDGWDKAAIANAAYDLIPDTVMLFGKPVPVSIVKSIVTRAAFIDFVKTKYDAFRAWELQNEQYLINQVAILKEADTAKTPDVGTKIAEIRAVLPPGETG